MGWVGCSIGGVRLVGKGYNVMEGGSRCWCRKCGGMGFVVCWYGEKYVLGVKCMWYVLKVCGVGVVGLYGWTAGCQN